ncbi:hypothetical protein FBEOM_1521 [Fusarium beomiforme]|uniref:Uncharacterized protein n=1 Tax=Fusarium beomiforme TaxID=44412 RepID=A0A9P5ATV4_9HYPO|nr:hypothetical protein FBEOM_1521 [Fusarium beomiforme]
MIRSPLQYSRNNNWILAHYDACSTVSHILWGAFITAWSSHFLYRIGKVILELILDVYEDPLWAIYEMLGLGAYSQYLLLRAIGFILATSFDFTFFLIAFLYKMSTYSLITSIILLGGITMWQLYYYFFVYTPEKAFQEPQTQPPKKEVPSTPDRPGRCFRVPTPSTGSSTSSSRSSPNTTAVYPQTRSNKLPGAAYVKVSPKAIQKLHDEGVFVPEPTREPDYSYIKPVTKRRTTVFSRLDAKRHYRAIKEAERKKGTVTDGPDPYKDDPPSPPTAPTKIAWIYSSLDAVERKLRFITEDVTKMNMLVNAFKEESAIRPPPPTSRALRHSPQTQKRYATLAEKDRIGQVALEYSRKINPIGENVLRQQLGLQESLERIDRLVTNAEDVASKAIRTEVADCKSRVAIWFKGAQDAIRSCRDIEQLCRDCRVKLEAEAIKLHRMDLTRSKYPHLCSVYW